MVGCLSERWQARQGVANYMCSKYSEILEALIGKSAIIGVMGKLHYPDLLPDIASYPWGINHNFHVLTYACNRRMAKSR
jgi:hypothetical protein